MKRDRWRARAASATVSAGALVFFAAGTGPASAAPRDAAQTSCKLGSLLCGILNGGKGKAATPPKSPTPSHTAGLAKPKPKAAPARPRHAGTPAGSAPTRHQPAAPPAAPSVPSEGPASGPGLVVPQPAGPPEPPPTLPGITSQDPVVLPEAMPAGGSQARLAAATGPADGAPSPLLVATASGLVGGVAALNLSVARRRLRRR
jgi:hypothetical protein